MTLAVPAPPNPRGQEAVRSGPAAGRGTQNQPPRSGRRGTRRPRGLGGPGEWRPRQGPDGAGRAHPPGKTRGSRPALCAPWGPPLRDPAPPAPAWPRRPRGPGCPARPSRALTVLRGRPCHHPNPALAEAAAASQNLMQPPPRKSRPQAAGLPGSARSLGNHPRADAAVPGHAGNLLFFFLLNFYSG